MLCTNVLDYTDKSDEPSSGEKRASGMSPKELRIAQRIVLELYCQYEQSLPFREVVSSEVTTCGQTSVSHVCSSYRIENNSNILFVLTDYRLPSDY